MNETTGAVGRRAAVAFIFVTVTLDMLAFGLVVPVLPRLVVQFEGGDYGRAATFTGIVTTVWAAMQLLAMPVLGALSDRFGRRPVVLFSTLGLSVSFALVALSRSLAWLVAARVVSGIASANISTASAYIADVTPPEGRAKAFGLLSAAFGLGFILGPVVGGLLGDGDPKLPFWVAAGLALLNFAYGLWVLPESLAPENRRPFTFKSANPWGAVRFLGSRPGLRALSVVTFLGAVANVVWPSMFVLFAGYRWHWSPRDVGLALGGVGVSSMVVGGALVGPAVRVLGERWAMRIGLLCGSIGFAAMAYGPSGTWFWIALVIQMPAGFTNAAVQATLSRTVATNEQGALQGATGALRSMADLIAPGLFAASFTWGVGPNAPFSMPGLPFAIASALLLLGALVAQGAL